jgi:hypothetical protein
MELFAVKMLMTEFALFLLFIILSQNNDYIYYWLKEKDISIEWTITVMATIMFLNSLYIFWFT